MTDDQKKLTKRIRDLAEKVGALFDEEPAGVYMTAICMVAAVGVCNSSDSPEMDEHAIQIMTRHVRSMVNEIRAEEEDEKKADLSESVH